MIDLQSVPLLSGQHTTEIVNEISLYTELKHFKVGDIIIHQHKPYNHLYILYQGSVKGEMVHPNGDMIEVERFSAPRAIAPAILFSSDNRIPVQVTAITDVELIQIAKNDYTQLLQQSETLLLNFLQSISDRSSFLSRKVREMKFGSIRSKIANYLYTQYQKQQSEIVILKDSHQNLADRFGVTRPSLTREFRKMEDDGIIKYERKIVHILNENRLKELID